MNNIKTPKIDNIILSLTDREYKRIKDNNIIRFNTQYNELKLFYNNKLKDLTNIFGKEISEEYRNINYFIKIYIIINQLIYKCMPIIQINKIYNSFINNIIYNINNKNIIKLNGLKETPIKKTGRIVEKLLIVNKKLYNIKDIIRSTIICNKWSNVLQLLEYIYFNFNYNNNNNYHHIINSKYNLNDVTKLNIYNINEYLNELYNNLNNINNYKLIISNIKTNYLNKDSYYADIQIEFKLKINNVVHICELQIITKQMYNAKKVGHKYYKFNRNLKELLIYLKNKYNKNQDTYDLVKYNKYSIIFKEYCILNKYYDLKWYKKTLINDLNINGNSGNIINTLLFLSKINSNISKYNIINIHNKYYKYITKFLKNDKLFNTKFKNNKNVKYFMNTKTIITFSKLVKIRIFSLNIFEKCIKKKHKKHIKKPIYNKIINFMKNIEIQYKLINPNYNILNEISISDK